MSIKDDIQTLVTEQEDLFKIHGRYIQALPTPEIMPTTGSMTNFTKLRKPGDETVEINFIPTAKDYQFRIDVFSGILSDKTVVHGYHIRAFRDLGDGITEIVETKEPIH